MAAVAAPYAGWLSAVAAQAQGRPGQARAVASAFETARLATVHPAEVAGSGTGITGIFNMSLLG